MGFKHRGRISVPNFEGSDVGLAVLYIKVDEELGGITDTGDGLVVVTSSE
jgi:hypothetical protein